MKRRPVRYILSDRWCYLVGDSYSQSRISQGSPDSATRTENLKSHPVDAANAAGAHR